MEASYCFLKDFSNPLENLGEITDSFPEKKKKSNQTLKYAHSHLPANSKALVDALKPIYENLLGAMKARFSTPLPKHKCTMSSHHTPWHVSVRSSFYRLNLSAPLCFGVEENYAIRKFKWAELGVNSTLTCFLPLHRDSLPG